MKIVVKAGFVVRSKFTGNISTSFSLGVRTKCKNTNHFNQFNQPIDETTSFLQPKPRKAYPNKPCTQTNQTIR
jgi:hypothetical protein